MTDARRHPDRPVIGVGAVVVKGDKLVLIQRGKPPRVGDWSLPGGALELGETIEDGIRREIQEETGLDVTLGPLIDNIDYVEKDASGTVSYHYVLLDYIAYHSSGEVTAGSDALDARFFTFEDALKQPLWSETKRIIEMAREIVRKQQ